MPIPAKATTEIVVVEDPARVQQVFRQLTQPVENRHILCRAHDESRLGFFVRAYRRILRLSDSFDVARIHLYDAHSAVYEGDEGASSALRKMVADRLGALVGDAFSGSENPALLSASLRSASLAQAS